MNKEYPFDDFIFYFDAVASAQVMRSLLSEEAALTEEEMSALKVPYEDFLKAAETGALPVDFTDPHMVREMLEPKALDISTVSSFAGTCETMEEMLPLITTKPIESSFDDDTIIYLPLDNGLSLFKTAYPSPSAILAELRSKLGKYLPDDFDYAARVCRIFGTYFS